jgi:hypothetical protein
MLDVLPAAQRVTKPGMPTLFGLGSELVDSAVIRGLMRGLSDGR